MRSQIQILYHTVNLSLSSLLFFRLSFLAQSFQYKLPLANPAYYETRTMLQPWVDVVRGWNITNATSYESTGSLFIQMKNLNDQL